MSKSENLLGDSEKSFLIQPQNKIEQRFNIHNFGYFLSQGIFESTLNRFTFICSRRVSEPQSFRELFIIFINLFYINLKGKKLAEQ